MKIIPAIDIINGQCVRLTKGDYNTKKVYDSDPFAVAKTFADQGADLIHLVDLDGAKAGQPINQDLIIKIATQLQTPVQVGGGIRTIAQAQNYLDNGIARIIIGTKAVTNPEFIDQLINQYGRERIIIGLDIKEGKVAISGWEQNTIDYQLFLDQLRERQIKNLIVTDISRDGTLTTPNFALYRELTNLNFNVIASGGVSDLPSLTTLQRLKVQGAIIGKALYENRLTIPSAKSAVDPQKQTNLTKRIIACLDVKDGKVVKGTNFQNLRDAGDPVELGKLYSQQGIDELVFLDISATNEKRQTVSQLVERIAAEIFIPFTVGGGINSIEDIRAILRAGADKISINSAAVKNPDLINQAAQEFGSQCIVVAIDAKKSVAPVESTDYQVFINGGTKPTKLNALDWAKEVAKRGAGEILLTSMDRDGTKSGFDNQLTRAISQSVSIPVIASGGAGQPSDFFDTFTIGQADAALAASIFHFGQIPISDLKEKLYQHGITIRR